MSSKKHEYQLEQWTILIRDRLNSGKSVRAWCAENKVTERKYYYWLKRIRQEHFDEAIKELRAADAGPASACVTIPAPVPQEDVNTFVELSRPREDSVITESVRKNHPAAVLRAGGIEAD